jgi:hypothetical protein
MTTIHEKRFAPITFEDVKRVLGLTIKGDDDSKLITFLCALTAYTDSCQFNVAFNAPSSTGKSYIPIEVSTLFPEEDVITLGHCSPTAFFYDEAHFANGSMSGVIELARRIIIFLDQPHFQLLERLRPILSHDKPEIKLKVTDKNNRGGLHTKNITVSGFPSVIFCTAGLNIDEQEATRFVLLSPDMGQEKIREAIYAKIKKESDVKKYRKELEDNEDRIRLKERIQAIKSANIKDVIIANEEIIRSRFCKPRVFLKPRHMRDVGKVLVFIKASALLNFWYRERNGNNILATMEDIENGFALWDGIHIFQELNLPPYIYRIYVDVIQPLCDSGKHATRKDIQQKYFEVYKCAIHDAKLRQEILPMLEAAALIVQEPDPSDHRRVMIFIPKSII